jgi:hypothetical protein
MLLKVVENEVAREAGHELLVLDEIERARGWRMPIAALHTEADDYVARHRPARATPRGTRWSCTTGAARTRKLTLDAGTVELQAPRVDDHRCNGQKAHQRFTSHGC